MIEPSAAMLHAYASGWHWMMKPGGTPHLAKDGKTRCGRSTADMKRSNPRAMYGCWTCHDLARLDYGRSR